MTVFRGDSGNGEAIEPREARETSGPAQVNGTPGTEALGAGAPGTGALEAGAPETEAPGTGALEAGAPETVASGAGTLDAAAPGTGIPRGDAPTASAMRRALARARDGKPLDADEATVLLHARGADLDAL